MKIKLSILFILCWVGSFAQSVPNTSTFTIGQVMLAIYGDSTVGRVTTTVFADSNASYFDATYGSKTMSPQTINGFRNYKPPTAVVPTVTTTMVTSITATTATSGGNVTADGGASVTARGVCWNTSVNPTVSSSHTSNGTGTGTFTSSLTGLTTTVRYYVRAYATNSAGTAYGQNETFVSTSVSNGGYGKLYNKYAVRDSRGIAAPGWHIPARWELDALITYIGGQTVAGGYLKEAGITHWETPNTGADNWSGFTSVGAGIRDAAIEGYIQEWHEVWAYEYDVVMYIAYNTATAYTGINVPLNRGVSVRLIKDDSTLAGYTGNDGKTYTTVKIGTQVWMSENLRETKYATGADIPQVTNYTTWNALVTGAWCWYNNNSGYE